jgi:group I intron endonuclease
MLRNVQYYMNLHLPRAVDNLRYRFRDIPIIYGIRCRVTGKMYIGSTLTPQDRFREHLISKTNSSPDLQADIKKYELSSFTVYILEIVQLPTHLSKSKSSSYLKQVEQTYIDRWPVVKRYNIRDSYARKY